MLLDRLSKACLWTHLLALIKWHHRWWLHRRKSRKLPQAVVPVLGSFYPFNTFHCKWPPAHHVHYFVEFVWKLFLCTNICLLPFCRVLLMRQLILGEWKWRELKCKYSWLIGLNVLVQMSISKFLFQFYNCEFKHVMNGYECYEVTFFQVSGKFSLLISHS